jgi:hypothetical protein
VRRPGIALIAAAAWVGVVVGHLVSYFATYPSQGLRHIHLAVTGHGWLGLATASLLGAIPVVILVVAIRSVRSKATWTGSGLALRLAAIQVPALVLIELMERGWSVGRALSDPAVFLGIALMPLLAIVTAWVLDLLHRAVRAIVVRFDRAARTVTRSFPRPVLDEPSQRFWLLLPSRRRAPPLPVST